MSNVSLVNARPLVIGLVAACITSSAAGAAGPATDGWWTTSPVPLAPDPDAGLVVQGSPQPEQPLAYAAVAFPLDDDEVPAQLTLAVPPDAVSTPGASLTVCPLVEPFEPERGAPADRAPAYDCTTSVAAVPEGTTYVIEVTGLEVAGELALALLPTTPADRIVLAPPGDDALTTEASSDDVATTLPSSGSAAPAAGASSSGSSSGAAPRPAPSTPVVRTPAPATAPVTPTTTAPAASSQAPAGVPANQPASSTSSDDGPNARLLLVLALVSIAVVLWLISGRADDAELVPEPAA